MRSIFKTTKVELELISEVRFFILHFKKTKGEMELKINLIIIPVIPLH